MGFKNAQIATSGFVDDLPGTLFRDSLANDHESRQAGAVFSTLGRTPVSVKQQESIKLVFKFVVTAGYCAHNQRMLVSKDDSGKSLARPAEQ